MGSFEFSILMILAMYGLFAIVAWLDDEIIHKADRDDIHHTHAHS